MTDPRPGTGPWHYQQAIHALRISMQSTTRDPAELMRHIGRAQAHGLLALTQALAAALIVIGGGDAYLGDWITLLHAPYTPPQAGQDGPQGAVPPWEAPGAQAPPPGAGPGPAADGVCGVLVDGVPCVLSPGHEPPDGHAGYGLIGRSPMHGDEPPRGPRPYIPAGPGPGPGSLGDGDLGAIR